MGLPNNSNTLCILLSVIIGVGLVGVSAIPTAHGKTYDPMVAFVCSKGAMHMDPELGWHGDSFTDCLGDKDRILNYCKSMYPSLQITNIVETSVHMVIKGWCPLEEKDCKEPDTFKVQPYRCLSGAFQSDALIVSRGCMFDHLHDSNVCESFSHWEAVASTHCRAKKNMGSTDSVAMLMPCGTDVFSGVEFVCCPDGSPSAETVTPSVPLEQPQISIKVSASKRNASAGLDSLAIINKYMNLRSSAGEYENEHDLYELAKKQLTSINHDKITQLMKDWSEARKRMMRLMETDPEQAKQTNAEVSNRYQKEYFALEMEEEQKTLQVDAIHQQHVQVNLNMQKRHSMERLMEELEAKFYSIERITSALQKYIIIEEKDAHHCIQHYIKIRARDPHAADEMLPTTIEHLTLINTRINQSIDLLDTLKDNYVVEKMKKSISKWLDATYVDLSKSIAQFKALDGSPKEDDRAGMMESELPKESASDNLGTTDDQSNMYKMYADKLRKTDFVKKPDMYDTDSLPPAPSQPQASNMKHGEVNAEVERLARNGASNSMSVGATTALALGVVAAMMIVVFAILIVKKKAHVTKKRFTNTYLEVPAHNDLSPEDRHITAMQNGYENPTYKLLEERKA